MVHDSLIILFTRFPRAGETKTRLISHLGAHGAALFQKTMTEFTIQQALATGIPVHIHFTGGTKEEMQAWLSDEFLCKLISHDSPCHNSPCCNFPRCTTSIDVEYIPQKDGDLGEKMEYAFKHAFDSLVSTETKNVKKVILIGTDCPDNRTDNILNALRMLTDSPCVIGPSMDGGYYLIGLTALHASQSLYFQLFHNIEWGTDTVLRHTKARAQKLAKVNPYQLLPILSDIDYPADIPAKISVIIPTLNEEKNLKQCLETLPRGFNIEIIVADGGSTDSTCVIAQDFGAIVCHTTNGACGRALQMSQGVGIASGEIIFFLHADSCVPPLWDKQIREIMHDTRNSLGHFRFALQENFRGKNIVIWGTNMRACVFNRPYGDQGLFVRKKDFEAWNVKVTPILEDVFLVKKARQNGKVCCTGTKLYTSGRRWLKHGVFRTLYINQGILLGAYVGIDLELLRDAYQQGKNPLFLKKLK